jgi:peptidoglycan/xylan/chitin deacetylase (PgdA/CDA1 family)
VSEVLVLCYHAISPTWNAALSVTPDALDKQLSTLVRNGWRGATFRDAVFDPPWNRTLAVTFDDAFMSVSEFAHPILSNLGLPGTVFVPTAFVSTRQRLQWPDLKHCPETSANSELDCMGWNDLEVLIESGWDVGSHTRTHPRLTHLDDDAARFELVESRRECTARLGVPCDTLAYPYGDVDERVAGFVASAGYVAAAALSSSLRGEGFHRWPRVGIYHGDQMWRFRMKTNRAIQGLRASRIWPAHG